MSSHMPLCQDEQDSIAIQIEDGKKFTTQVNVSAAGVDVFLDGADLASDFTAPFETTVTVDASLGRARIVAPTAAQELATFDAG